MDSKVSENKHWVAEHTLTAQDLRQLILEKAERARLQQMVEENRRLSEFA